MAKIMFNEKSYSNAALNVLNAGLPLDREFTKTYNSITQDSWYDVVNYSDIDPKAIYLYRIEFHDNNFIYNESAYFMLGWPPSTNSANVSTIYANFSGHAPNSRVISLRFNRTGNASSHTEAIQFSISNGAITTALTAKVKCYKVNGDSLMDLVNKFISTNGGKMNGPLSFENENAYLDMKKAPFYLRPNYYGDDEFGMDAGNSNIIGLNQLRFADVCDNSDEGIIFKQSNGKWASIWVDGTGSPWLTYDKNSPGATDGGNYRLVTNFYYDATNRVTLTPTNCTVVTKKIVRFGQFLSFFATVRPNSALSAGGTAYLKLTSSTLGIPQTALFGVASGSAFYGNKCFSYQFNTDDAGTIKIRTHDGWNTSENLGIALNIPLLSY